MPYIRMLPDPGISYTLKRPLLDGTSPAWMKKMGAVASRIKDYESWARGLARACAARTGREALVDKERLPSSVLDWCITQGMHITGTKTPFDFL
jgi:hypothetical protein